MSGRAERCYALALRLLPAALRSEFGADMASTFGARVADARRSRRLARFIARELAGVVTIAVAERLTRARPRRPEDPARNRKGLGPMEHLTRELRHGGRRLLHTPGFAAAAVITLTLAIGAHVAIFALVQRIALAPLPYAAQERLVSLEHAAPGAGVPAGMGISTGLYREYATVPALEALAMYNVAEGTVSGPGDPERLRYLSATSSLSDVLGVTPALGRWFAPAEMAPGGEPVVILTHQQWATRWGSDPGVLGATLRLNGVVREIVGVLPPGFAFPDPQVQALVPLQFDAAAATPGGFNAMAVARMRPGATLQTLQGQLDAVVSQLPERFPSDAAMIRSILTDAGLAATPVLLRERVLRGATQRLWVLLGAATLVLLIACANLGNLFLVRAETRQREIAVRRALGASTGRIIGHHLSETLLIALTSGALGLLCAHLALAVLIGHAPAALPRLHEVRVGGMEAIHALALALVAGAGFVALQLLRQPRASGRVLRESARGAAGGARAPGRELLMLVQVAIAVVLLVGAGLMIQSFRGLQQVDPGFRTDDALAFGVALPAQEYAESDAAAFHDQLLERLRELPGVEAAALTTTLPLGGDGWGDPLDVRGAAADGEIRPIARYRRVSPGYFETLGIPLRAGRLLDSGDALGAGNSAVIDEALAAIYFPGEDPIGRQVRPLGQDGDAWFTIVGVVGATATHGLAQPEPTAQIYFPLRTGITSGTPGVRSVSYVLRTAGPPLALVPAVRRVVRDLDPHLALARVETLEARRAQAGAATAFMTLLLVSASGIALTLGLIGVYAVISYVVTQRTSEIGLRLALGAQPRQVMRMILGQSGRVVAAGIGIGLAAAAAGAHALQGLVFGVAPRDPLTYAAVAAGLFAVALAACWLPARRAARVSPLSSLQGTG